LLEDSDSKACKQQDDHEAKKYSQLTGFINAEERDSSHKYMTHR